MKIGAWYTLLILTNFWLAALTVAQEPSSPLKADTCAKLVLRPTSTLNKDEVAYLLIDLKSYFPRTRVFAEADNVDGTKLIQTFLKIRQNVGQIIRHHELRELFWRLQTFLAPFRESAYQISAEDLTYLKQLILQKITLDPATKLTLSPAAVVKAFEMWTDLIIRQHLAPVIFMPAADWSALLDSSATSILRLTQIWNARADELDNFNTWLKLKYAQGKKLILHQDTGKFQMVRVVENAAAQTVINEAQITAELWAAYPPYLKALAKALQKIGLPAKFKAAPAVESSTARPSWDQATTQENTLPAGWVEVTLDPTLFSPSSSSSAPHPWPVSPETEFLLALHAGLTSRGKIPTTPLTLRLGDVGQALFKNFKEQKLSSPLTMVPYQLDPAQNLLLLDPMALWSNVLLGATATVQAAAALAFADTIRPRLHIFPAIRRGDDRRNALRRMNRSLDFNCTFEQAFSFTNIDLHWVTAQYLQGRLADQTNPLSAAHQDLARQQLTLLYQDLHRFIRYTLRAVTYVQRRLTADFIERSFTFARILPNRLNFTMTNFCMVNRQSFNAAVMLQDAKFYELWQLQGEDLRNDPALTNTAAKLKETNLSSDEQDLLLGPSSPSVRVFRRVLANPLWYNLSARPLRISEQSKSYLYYFRDKVAAEEEHLTQLLAQVEQMAPEEHLKNMAAYPLIPPSSNNL